MNSSTSSGRRKTPRESPSMVVIVVVAVIALVMLLVVLSSTRRRVIPVQPTPQPPPAASTPRQSPTETVPESPPTNDPVEEAEPDPGFETDTDSSPEATAAPTETDCVQFSWQAEFIAGAEAPVPVQITISNSCGFEVDCAGIVFEVEGIREAQTARTMTGSYQGILGPGETALFTITLPSDPEGYERLAVVIPGAR